MARSQRLALSDRGGVVIMRPLTKFEALRLAIGTALYATGRVIAGLPPWFVLLGVAIGGSSVAALAVFLS